MQYQALNEQLRNKLLTFCKANGIKEAICIFKTEWGQISLLTASVKEGMRSPQFNELHSEVKRIMDNADFLKPAKK